MSNINKSLEVLDIGKTVIFTTPFSGYDNYLVRTGVIQENNSFLHSLLTGYSKDYFYMDIKSKKKFLDKFNENIFTIKEFEKDINNYTMYKLSVIDSLKNIYSTKENITDKRVKKILKHISKNPVSELLPEILPYDDIIKIFEVNIELNNDDNMFTVYKDLIKHETKNYLNSLDIFNHVKDQNKVQFIKKNVKNIISIVLEETEFYEYNKYYDEITKELNIKMLNTLTNNLKLDVYFIDSKNKLPFKYNENQVYKNKKSVIILKLEDTYETIGLLLDGNKVQRNFESNNFLIKKFKTFLFETDKIASKYPELLQYIAPSSRILRNKRHILDESDNQETVCEGNDKIKKIVHEDSGSEDENINNSDSNTDDDSDEECVNNDHTDDEECVNKDHTDDEECVNNDHTDDDDHTGDDNDRKDDDDHTHDDNDHTDDDDNDNDKDKIKK